MTYLRQVRLERRTLLRGLGGVAVSLPFLDAMMPAAASAATQARLSPRRLAFIYFPNGHIKDAWTPLDSGANYTLSPSLEPLAAHKDKFLVLTGLACDPSHTKAGFHDRAINSFLTGVEMSRTEVRVGTSVDQIAARTLGEQTPFPSLEIGVQELGPWGSPNFRTATQRLPIENNPRALFERLFGEADRLDPIVMAELKARQRSILDLVLQDARELQGALGGSDKVKLDEYLSAVRELERRLAITDRISAQSVELDRPEGIPDDYAEHVRTMFDLQHVAMQTDLTRVSTFMMAQEASNMAFPTLDWPNSHHLTSHHGGDARKIDAMRRINRYQVGLFEYMVGKMAAVQESDGSLLDNTLMIYGSSLGDADRHMQVDLPILLAGGANMGVSGGRHVDLGKDVPISNLYLTMLDKVGVPVDQLGDSTGKLEGLGEV